jgi:hypothetical protein
MARRERQRAERRKRKERSAERREQAVDRQVAMAERSEARNRAAREALEPLAEDERPTVVTVGALISAAIALFGVIAFVAGIEVTEFSNDGVELGTERPNLLQVAPSILLLGAMAWGMWNSKYWAVLGYQAVLAIVLVVGSLSLVQATTPLQAIALLVVIAAAGAMFYLMIKAMARIQMPERLPRE